MTPTYDGRGPVHGFTREQRAERIEAALATYCPLVGYERDWETDELTVAGLVADLHHWCTVHGYDFNFVLDMAGSFWNEEQTP